MSSGRWGIEASVGAGIKKPPGGRAAGGFDIDHEEVSVLGRPGSDLLFQVLRLSTIGAGEFYGRVRDGIGYRLPASTTRPAKDRCMQSWSFVTSISRHHRDECALKIRAIKPNERLVPVS
jgi:hypothetical protein